MINYNLNMSLYLDIETVPQVEKLEDFPEKLQKLWIRKSEALAKEGESAEKLFERAGIYVEFGKSFVSHAAQFTGEETKEFTG